MMSIRSRLVVFCVVVSLLPAIPLSFVVRSLLEKSLNIGLNPTVEDALQSGLAVSRAHLAALHADFERKTGVLLASLDEAAADSAAIDRTLQGSVGLRAGIDGFVVRTVGNLHLRAALSAATSAFEGDDVLAGLAGGSPVVERVAARSESEGLRFFETESRAIQFAVWAPRGRIGDDHSVFVFFKRTDADFLANAERLLEASQIFAQLQLRRPTLSRSFFYPFVLVYAAILLISVVVALATAERLSGPIRRLAEGAKTVAAGDWTHRIAPAGAGEVGALVRAFNEMVSRLDAQSRRLVDVEKMAAWRDIARHLAHEIKNPLLPIRLTVEELRDQYGGDDARYRELVEESARVVGDELDHLQNLVKEFSSFARMPDLSIRVGSLEALVRDVARLYSQVETRIEVDPDIPDFAFDADQMRRVLVNLMDNALAVAKGGEAAQVRVRLVRSDGSAVMTVSDNGPGIPAEIKRKVFDPYFTTRKEGSGLGLAVVKNIVLMHGGSIDVGGGEGEGAVFTITLPLKESM
jgi:two-component system nitrogen regulation sensor histidine kinase NtrY